MIRIAFILTVCLFTPKVACEAAEQPNIVLIISDDQAWTDYGFMGHPQIRTPHLDRLANQSLTFTRGYVPDSLCRPSLATILTGLYPHQHKIVGNDPPPPDDLAGQPKRRQRADPRYLQRRIEYIRHIDRVATLPRLLGKSGYLSHQSGKWWEGNYRRGGFTHGMTHGDRRRGGRHGDKGLTIGRQGLKPVRDFIEVADKEDKPFLVYYAPFLPHTPHNPPGRLLKKYRETTPSLPIAKYYAMCEWFDETVGELLGILDERGLTENTLVVYVTDNGWINRQDRTAFAPRSKRSPYEGGIRTPIMIRFPGRVTPRRDQQSLASSIDIAPTVLAAAGLKPTDRMDGVNLLDDDSVRSRKCLFGEIFEHDVRHMTDPEQSLRFRWTIQDQWKLIVPAGPNPKGVLELFDLSVDPTEKRNLAKREAERVRKLTQSINVWTGSRPK